MSFANVRYRKDLRCIMAFNIEIYPPHTVNLEMNHDLPGLYSSSAFINFFLAKKILLFTVPMLRFISSAISLYL
jgi:hypothetical protein